ncbi:hypothetical protein B0H17DRAFT_1104724 [Mycena rosella]|uniref:Uncharacterized protein n=1 Tax=Mycena rosella TaxID=1033263 RepID=A0AAD7C9N3_MYCRO|nr:hypothetical protein B0H17DRAFT_1104724 [Mycena rosella]
MAQQFSPDGEHAGGYDAGPQVFDVSRVLAVHPLCGNTWTAGTWQTMCDSLRRPPGKKSACN